MKGYQNLSTKSSSYMGSGKARAMLLYVELNGNEMGGSPLEMLNYIAQTAMRQYMNAQKQSSLPKSNTPYQKMIRDLTSMKGRNQLEATVLEPYNFSLDETSFNTCDICGSPVLKPLTKCINCAGFH